eukprot:6173079-Pleurochrysis_carterae.AAC.4
MARHARAAAAIRVAPGCQRSKRHARAHAAQIGEKAPLQGSSAAPCGANIASVADTRGVCATGTQVWGEAPARTRRPLPGESCTAVTERMANPLKYCELYCPHAWTNRCCNAICA